MEKKNIKIRVSSFVILILEADCHSFGFMKNGKPNKNGLVGKLLPTLVDIRKYRRNQIIQRMKSDYQRSEADELYNLINYLIDEVYFTDIELDDLEEDLILRPTEDTLAVYDEITESETKITAQCTAEYIRGLLNEYVRFPQYKRQAFVFDRELELFDSAIKHKNEIIYRVNDIKHRAICFNYYYGFVLDQTNYFIIYDIDEKKIKAISITLPKNIRVLNKRFKVSKRLADRVQKYIEDYDFESEVQMEGDDVF